MKILKPLLLFCFLLISRVLVAQVTDSLPHFTMPDSLPTLVLDSPVKKIAKPDTIPAKAPGIKFHSNYVINGKVEDAGTGEGIPYATVFFPHTPSGVAADLDGNFVIDVPKLPKDTLRIEALGYKGINKILKKERHDYNFIIELERSNVVMDEVVFHAGEDPAITLMKQVIKNKPNNNPDRIDNYSYEAYNRMEADLQRMTKEQFSKIPMLKSYGFIFDNLDTVSDTKPFLPLYLTEALSDYYYQSSPKKQREFIKATMVKGVNNENVDKYLGSMYQNVNIYSNFINVFDKKFVSPISNDGLFYYKYKIVDTHKAYGHRIIRLSYRPKRSGENCFVGDFWIVDTAFAIQRMSMDVPKAANLNWVDKVSLYQEFAPVDTMWFCIKDKFIANFTLYNSKKIPGMIGRKTTTYHNIKINDTSVTRILADPQFKTEVVKSDSSRRKSDDWWLTNRPDSLSKNELAIHKMVDTINAMPITRIYKNTITFLASGVKDFGPIELGPYFYVYSMNPIEGNRFRFSAGTPRTLKNAHFTGYVAYGTKDERWKYGFTGLWILKREPRIHIFGSYVHDLSSSINHPDYLSNDNIFSNLFRKPGIPWKLAFSNDEKLEINKEYHSGFSHKLILQHSDYTPDAPLPYKDIFFDRFDRGSDHIVNSEVGVLLRYAYKEKFIEGKYKRLRLGSKYPVFNLELSKGLKDVLNSGYEYEKARLGISEKINVPPFGHISYNIFAGKYFGTLPYPLLEIHRGNEYYYYNKYAFQMMNSYEFISDEYVGFNFEHDLGGGIFNRIPALKKLKFRQFWTAKGVIGSLSPENQRLNLNKGFPFRTLDGDPYLEIGTGVSNILELFRIDFDWRVTPKPISSEAKSRYFGIFVSVNFEF